MFHGTINTQWQPLTLQGAGLFHIAMGAIIGVAAWGRTQEKLGGANNGGIQLPANIGTTYQPPGMSPTPVSAPVASVPVVAPPPVTTGFGGRLGPVQPPQPIL
jgi:hypothetical protein